MKYTAMRVCARGHLVEYGSFENYDEALRCAKKWAERFNGCLCGETEAFTVFDAINELVPVRYTGWADPFGRVVFGPVFDSSGVRRFGWSDEKLEKTLSKLVA